MLTIQKLSQNVVTLSVYMCIYLVVLNVHVYFLSYQMLYECELRSHGSFCGDKRPSLRPDRIHMVLS